MSGKNISSPSHLEQELERFQSSLGVPPVPSADKARQDMQKAFEQLTRERMRHPEQYLLSDLQLHIICLKQFLDGAEATLISPESLVRMASLVNVCYVITDDGIMRNSLLDVEDEIQMPNFSSPESYQTYTEKWQPDVSIPTVLMGTIRELRAEIKILEAKRMGILSCATLLANTLDQHNRADIARRLLRFWSGFKMSFAELLASDAYGDFMFALAEIQKMRTRRDPLSLSAIPQRLYRRYKDYSPKALPTRARR